MRWAAVLAVCLGLCGVAFSDEAPSGTPSRVGRRSVSGARSVGAPSDGHLEHGLRLRETDFLKILPDAAPRGRQFGTEELVGVLLRAAEKVANTFPGSVLRVADLSTRGGGDVHMHASHESGRDADVAFYLRDPSGTDAQPTRFVKLAEDGRNEDGSLLFDAERNWAFIEALLGDRRAGVSHVFVAEPLKAMLLAQARVAGAPAAVLTRAQFVLSQPRGSYPHDNHFHVRVSCARDDKPECVEGKRPSRRRRRS